jgi:hypothetical protein
VENHKLVLATSLSVRSVTGISKGSIGIRWPAWPASCRPTPGETPVPLLVVKLAQRKMTTDNRYTIMANKKKLHGLSPWANYTDRATAACQRSDCQLLQVKDATWSAWQILRPYSRFSRQEPLLFYQVAPQLYSRGWVDPVPDPLLFFSGSAGNRNPSLRICSQGLWPLDHRRSWWQIQCDNIKGSVRFK